MLVQDLVHDEQVIRDATAAALASFLRKHGSLTETVLEQVLVIYEDKLYVSAPRGLYLWKTGIKDVESEIKSKICDLFKRS